MTTQSRNRLIAVGAMAIAAVGLAFLAFGNLGDNLVYYWSPGELQKQGDRAYGPTIRLGGVVKPGTIQWDATKQDLAFTLADSHQAGAPQVQVHSREVPPQMFRDGINVVVEGTWSKAAVFESNRLMVNHSNEYRTAKPDGGVEYKQMPPEHAENMKAPSP